MPADFDFLLEFFGVAGAFILLAQSFLDRFICSRR